MGSGTRFQSRGKQKLSAPKPRRNPDALRETSGPAPWGRRFLAGTFGRQVAKRQVRIAVLNGHAARAMPVTEALGQVCPGEGGTLAISRFLRPSRFCLQHVLWKVAKTSKNHII